MRRRAYRRMFKWVLFPIQGIYPLSPARRPRARKDNSIALIKWTNPPFPIGHKIGTSHVQCMADFLQGYSCVLASPFNTSGMSLN